MAPPLPDAFEAALPLNVLLSIVTVELAPVSERAPPLTALPGDATLPVKVAFERVIEAVPLTEIAPPALVPEVLFWLNVELVSVIVPVLIEITPPADVAENLENVK